MVYVGRSFACTTCKKRRVKCDGARPFCRNCTKRKVPCPGVPGPPGIRFQDETTAIIQLFQKAQNEETYEQDQRNDYPDAVLPDLGEDENFTSLCFFYHNYMMSGRGIQSSRGLFEHLIPYFQLTDSDSLLSVATAALAASMLSMWRGLDLDSPLSRKYTARAIMLMKEKIGSSVESEADTVLIAIIALQFREGLIAHRKMIPVDGSHQRGAYAVVNHRKSIGFRSMASKKLLQEVRSTMISEAIRTHQPVHIDPGVWEDDGPLPANAASDLDKVAIDLAHLQALYERYKSTLQAGFANGQTVLTAKDLSIIASFRRAATTLEQRLQIWADLQPSYFTPCRMTADEIPESVRTAGMYGKFCNVYPTVQLAGVWHAYNSYRLILLKMTLCADQTVQELPRENDVLFAESGVWRKAAERTLQHCIDEICAAVPFHLGNRTGTGSIYDFSNTGKVEFPWPAREKNPYSNPDNAAAIAYVRQHNVIPLNDDERKRQNIAMGGYNIIGSMAFVLGLAGEPLDMTGSRSDALKLGSLLRRDQIPWLVGQWYRALKLHRIRSPHGACMRPSTLVQPTSSVKNVLATDLEKEVDAINKAMKYSFGV